MPEPFKKADFTALLELLSNNGIEFIVVGGAAATAQGSARLTLDLDVVYRRTPENIWKLADALSCHKPYLRGAPPGLPFRWDADAIRRGLNFTLETDLGNLDLLGEVTGGGNYEALLPFAERKIIYESECLCLGLRKLIEVKRAAGARATSTPSASWKPCSKRGKSTRTETVRRPVHTAPHESRCVGNFLGT